MTLKGKQFGRWLVISDPICRRKSENQKPRTYYLCRCSCGTEREVLLQNLNNGSSKSCGCLNRELAAERMGKYSRKHGLSKSRIYKTWLGMRDRCSIHDHRGYYYNRGIRCCKEWKEDFIKFYQWAMDNGYNDTLTLDRIDNSKGYSPDNCRWATWTQQQRNKTNNRIITYSGKSMTLVEWAEFYHTTRGAINYRDKHHLPLECPSH